MRQHGIDAIDLIVVNLYPFAATIARPDCTFEDAIENIDIGGPAMVRASAKNHDRVTIVVDPTDYPAVLQELESSNGTVSADTRKRLAATVGTNRNDLADCEVHACHPCGVAGGGQAGGEGD